MLTASCKFVRLLIGAVMTGIHELRKISRLKNNPQGLALPVLVVLTLAVPSSSLLRSLQYGCSVGVRGARGG
jgi:hypothetical protein